MLVEDIINLIDFPDQQKVSIYDYDVWDIVQEDFADAIYPSYYSRTVRGIEIKDSILILNLESTK